MHDYGFMVITAVSRQGTSENMVTLPGRVLLLVSLLAGKDQQKQRSSFPKFCKLYFVDQVDEAVFQKLFPFSVSVDLTLQFMSANLASHLSVKQDDQIFKTINDVERLDLDVYVRGSGATYDHFAKYFYKTRIFIKNSS